MNLNEYLRANPKISDADAAAALSGPIKTAKSTTVTLRSLGGTWGLARAVAFRAWLVGAGQSANAELAAFAGTILALLDGPGFEPGHPDVTTAVTQLVSLQACTSDEADAVLYDITYATGAIVSAEDVAAARAANLRDDAMQWVRDRLSAIEVRAQAAIDAGERDTAALAGLFTVET